MLQRVMSRFSVKNSFLIVPKSAVGKPFSVSLFSRNGKVRMIGWGGWQDFCVENFLSDRAEKFRRANLHGVISSAY